MPLVLPCCVLVGFGLILFLATGQSVVQLGASDRNRGRIMGTWAMVLSGAVPLGSLLVGLAADHWGVPAVLRWQGLACIAAALTLIALYWIWGRLAKGMEQGGHPECAAHL
jgi:MFS family permease